jgi:tetratricopeptide (TPR) repeat protein
MSAPDVHATESGRRTPAVWGSVPQRNKNFTGREALLEDLHRRMRADRSDVTAVLPHALHGYGGVGKTQLAVEYAYRYQNEYDLVWWVQADQGTVVRSSLASLAPRLGLSGHASARVEEAVAAVLDALRKGVPYERWLVVFDNADQPETLRGELLPHGPGHVLVTSRNHRWQGVADAVAVDVFSREESLGFLTRRVPDIASGDATRLAEALGDLPLALEQAGALQVETGMSAETYLDLLERETAKLLGEGQSADYPVPVAAAWSVSVSRLSNQMPDAMELLRRCAYFGEEPIPLDVLNRGRFVLGPPLSDTFSDPLKVSRAFRELGRYALARIDNHRKTLQVHRLIQLVIRNEVSEADAPRIRHEVHLLLSATDPGDPDDTDNWPVYAELLPHVRPSGALECDEPRVRQLARNVVRYLYATGNYAASRSWADRALERWRLDSGDHDADVLIMLRHMAGSLRAMGSFADAYELSRRTLEPMRTTLGENHEETLILLNNHAADLRARGEFAEARRLDEDSLHRHRMVFGDHRRTFMSAGNLAEDYALTGDYRQARELDETTYRDRRNFYGRDDHLEVLRSRSALARHIRQAGDYLQAHVEHERVREIYLDLVRRGVLDENHPHVLQQAVDLGVTRRLVGAYADALALLKSTYELSQRRFGEAHAETLPAAVALGNALLIAGDLDEAASLVDKTVGWHDKALGSDHPLALGCMVNQSVARRRLGDVSGGRAILDSALDGLRRRLGPEHHFGLICLVNLATADAALGKPERAAELGQDALPLLRSGLGEDHPHTLICALNLGVDLRSLGRDADAAEVSGGDLDRYRQRVGKDHPEVPDAAAGRRLELLFEPPPL